MKRLRAFAYHEPDTLAEATRILASEGPGARVLAGGTDLVVDMKTGRMRPPTIVNLKRIEGLAGISRVSGGTRIGALTSVADVERSALVRECHGALAMAAAVLASPPVRRLATVGGNIGRASPASDLAPALLAHEAVATITGSGGSREEPIERIFVGPGVTALSHDELIESVFLPVAGPRSGAVHLKIGSRGSGTDIAVVAVSVAVSLGQDGAVTRARIALASVAPTPIRAADAEEVVAGALPTGEVLARAAEAAVAACRPISDVRAGADHRAALVGVLTRRALEQAVARAAGSEEAG